MTDGRTKTDDDDREPRLPWYKWFVFDWSADEMSFILDMEGQGCYRHLLDRQWVEGSIPADPDELADICRLDAIRFRERIWPRLSKRFEPLWGDSERLVNPKLHEQRTATIDEVRQRMDAGRLGGKRSGEARRRKAAKKKATKRKRSTPSKSLQAKSKQTRTDTDTDTDTDLSTKSITGASGRAGVPTWLTPFDDEWAKNYGGTPFIKPGSKTAGELGRAIKLVCQDISKEPGFEGAETRVIRREAFARWRAYLPHSRGKGSPSHFMKTHGLYKGGRFPEGVQRGAQQQQPARAPSKPATPNSPI